MRDARQLRQILSEIDRVIRRFHADATPAGGTPPDLGPLRHALAPLTAEIEAGFLDLDADARLGRLAIEMARLFAADSGPRAFCQAALDAIAPAMRDARGWVATFGPDASEATLVAERDGEANAVEGGHALSRSLLAEVATRKAAILVGDAQETSLVGETSIAAMNLRSVLIAPLLVQDQVIGAIGLESVTLARAFTEDDRALLEGIAALLAPYVHVGARLDASIEDRARLQAELSGESIHEMVGHSPALRALSAMIERLKGSDAPVLVEGESGTGKELVARALHFSGARAAGPLIVVNCAAIPEGLMESELFGHERGAFTGATGKKLGKLEQAHRGTLFLDEIGELRLDLQAKLLRALQEQAFERVGGSETIRVNVRVVAATNRDLRRLTSEGRFREDLFHRLFVVPLKVPPLRERPEDVAPLVQHFLAELARTTGKRVTFDAGVMEALRQYPFPGNIRELRNLVHRLVALAASERVTEADLPEHVRSERSVSIDKNPFRRFAREEPASLEELRSLRAEMGEAFARHVREVEAKFYAGLLARVGGNVSEAARLVGMNRTALHRRLAELKVGEA